MKYTLINIPNMRCHHNRLFARKAPIVRGILIRAKYTSDDKKPVFQYHENGPPISFHEMEEAHSIFSEFPIEHRNDCYAMYNINGEAMKKYYRDAVVFERMYQRVVEHERKQKAWHFKIGPFHVYISKD